MEITDIRPDNVGTDMATESKIIFLDINKFLHHARDYTKDNT